MSKKKYITNSETIHELKRIYKENGGILLPKTVVNEARNPKNPLHCHFQWDNTKAAEAYRIEQARSLLQVTVEIIDIGGDKRPVRVFASLSTDRDAGGYRTTIDALTDKDMRECLIKDALRDIDFFERRYREIKELSAVIKVMKSAKRKLAR